ncbi:MAG: Ig-like domain-containing protein [Eubacteriales bacterium]|nr:Ig-like domain-containing protein [Eubacteriales bacterium]
MKKGWKKYLSIILSVALLLCSCPELAELSYAAMTALEPVVHSTQQYATGSDTDRETGAETDAGEEAGGAAADTDREPQTATDSNGKDIEHRRPDALTATSSDAGVLYFETEIDGIGITIEDTMEVLPAGTVAYVTRASASDAAEIEHTVKEEMVSQKKRVKEIAAFDITLECDGRIIEPEDSVRVRFDAKEKLQDEEWGVDAFFVDEDRVSADILISEEVEPGVLALDVDHFSTYGVALYSMGKTFYISTVEDLYNVRFDMTADYVLLNDIVLNKDTPWIPIGWKTGGSTEEFEGTFDGSGYTIFGLHFELTPEQTVYGLFERVGGTVKNLMLNDIVISDSADVTTDHSFQVGLVAHTLNGGHIEKCESYGRIHYDGQAALTLAGICYSASTPNATETSLADCINYANIKLDSPESSAFGIAFGGGKVIRCGNQGDISAGHMAAGIAYSGTGYSPEIGNDRQVISGCYNTGDITAGHIAAGIVYTTSNIDTSFNAGKITVENSDIDAGAVKAAGLAVSAVRAQKTYNSGDVVLADTGTPVNMNTACAAGLVCYYDCILDSFNSGEVKIDYRKEMVSEAAVFYAAGLGCIDDETGMTDSQRYRKILSCYQIGRVSSAVDGQSYVGSISSLPCKSYSAVYGIEGYKPIGQETELPEGSITILSDSQMKNQDSFRGWDFTGTWEMGNEKFLYPVLQGMVSPERLNALGLLNINNGYIQITDMDQKPIAGANVYVYEFEGELTTHGRKTDQDGMVMLGDSMKMCAVSVIASGYCRQMVANNFEKRHLLKICLEKEVTDKPYFTTALEYNSRTEDTRNLFQETATYATTDSETCSLYLDVEWNDHTPKKCYIFQENSEGGETKALELEWNEWGDEGKWERSSYRAVFKPGAKFDFGRDIYAVAETADGVRSEPLNLHINLVKRITHPTDYDLEISGGGSGLWKDDNRNIFGGEFEITAKVLKVKVEEEYDKNGIQTVKYYLGAEKELKDKRAYDFLKAAIEKGKSAFVSGAEKPLVNLGPLKLSGEFYVFHEEKIDPNGVLLDSSGGILIKGKGKWGKTVPVGTWGYFDVEGGLTGKISGEVKRSAWDPRLTVDGDVEIDPYGRGEVAAGLPFAKGLLSFGGYGTLNPKIRFKSPTYGIINVKLGMVARFIGAEKTFERDMLDLYLWGKEKRSAAAGYNLAAARMYYDNADAAQYTEPLVMRTGASQVMTYFTEASGSTGTGRSLTYRVDSGSGWSAPEPVTDPEQTEAKAVLCCGSDGLYLAWEQWDAGTEALEIMTAKFNPQTGTFTDVHRNTVNGRYKTAPELVCENGTMELIWGQAADENGSSYKILRSSYTGGSWQEEEVLGTLEQPVGAVAAGESGQGLSVAVTAGDVLNGGDMEIYLLTGGVLTQITDNSIYEGRMLFHGGNLYWNGNGFLYCHDLNRGMTATVLDESAVVNSTFSFPNEEEDKVVWAGYAGEDEPVIWMSRCTDGVWSSPVKADELPGTFERVAFSEDENGSLITVSNIVSDTGSVSIETGTSQAFTDLELSDIYMPVSYAETAQHMRYAVENKGTEEINGFILTVTDQNGAPLSQERIDSRLLPGEKQIFTADVTFDPLLTTEITAEVLAENDSNAGNQRMTEIVGGMNLELKAYVSQLKENKYIRYEVWNHSAVPVEEALVTIHEDTADGRIIHQETLKPFEEDTFQIGTCILNDANINYNGRDIKAYVAEVSTLEEDVDSSDNKVYLTVYKAQNEEVQIPDGPMERYVAAEGITAAQSQVELQMNGIEPVQLNVSVLPANATCKELIWESADTDVAAVSGEGVLMPVGVGDTVIRVTSADGGFTAEIAVQVRDSAGYQLTVVSGSGSGLYQSGQAVQIQAAEAAEGMQFYRWNTLDDMVLTDPYAAQTTIVMGDSNTKVEAEYVEAESGGTVTPDPDKPDPDKPNADKPDQGGHWAEDSADDDDAPVRENGSWMRDAYGWWYRNEDATYPKSAWRYIGGQWYWFDDSGYMAVGWRRIRDKWYYLKPDGAMAVGWIQYRGGWYFLHADGSMAHDTVISGRYRVDSTGRWVE